MIQLIALFISLFVFVGYLVFCYNRFGYISYSISSTFYDFTGKLRYLYTLFMITFAFSLFIAGGTLLLYFATILMIATGVAADTRRDKLTGIIHYIGANVGILLGLLSLFIDFGLWWLSVIGVCGILFVWLPYMKSVKKYFQWLPKVDNHTYWIEVIAFIVVWTGILIHIL